MRARLERQPWSSIAAGYAYGHQARKHTSLQPEERPPLCVIRRLFPATHLGCHFGRSRASNADNRP